MYTYLAAAVIAFATGFGAAWQWQGGNIVKLELNHANERTAIERQNRTAFEANQAAVIAAQNSAVIRNNRNTGAAGAAINAGNGLRIASADAVRAAKDDNAACLASVALYDSILESVVEAGGNMAAEADRWESDAITLHEAWPK